MQIWHKSGVKFTANTDRSMSRNVLLANFEKSTYLLVQSKNLYQLFLSIVATQHEARGPHETLEENVCASVNWIVSVMQFNKHNIIDRENAIWHLY